MERLPMMTRARCWSRAALPLMSGSWPGMALGTPLPRQTISSNLAMIQTILRQAMVPMRKLLPKIQEQVLGNHKAGRGDSKKKGQHVVQAATLPPYYLATLPPCHLVTLPPCHLATLPPCHLAGHLCDQDLENLRAWRFLVGPRQDKRLTRFDTVNDRWFLWWVVVITTHAGLERRSCSVWAGGGLKGCQLWLLDPMIGCTLTPRSHEKHWMWQTKDGKQWENKLLLRGRERVPAGSRRGWASPPRSRLRSPTGGCSPSTTSAPSTRRRSSRLVLPSQYHLYTDFV